MNNIKKKSFFNKIYISLCKIFGIKYNTNNLNNLKQNLNIKNNILISKKTKLNKSEKIIPINSYQYIYDINDDIYNDICNDINIFHEIKNDIREFKELNEYQLKYIKKLEKENFIELILIYNQCLIKTNYLYFR